MSVSDFAILSLQDAKSFLNISSADSDAWLEQEINAVSEEIERWLDRRIVPRTYREDIGADMENYTLYLANTPVLEVSKVYDDPDLKFDADTLVDKDKYNVFDDRIEFRTYQSPYIASGRRKRWQRLWVTNSIRIEYVAGYGDIEIPFSKQRVDFKETDTGDTETVYLNSGRWSPLELIEDLNVQLNTVGAHTREASYDWRTRRFTIKQTDGALTLFPSVLGSALVLLGFTGSEVSGPATGSGVSLEVPSDLKRAALNVLALNYDAGSHGDGTRGLRSRQMGDYREEYANRGTGTGGQSMTFSPFPADIESMLIPYRRATYV